MAMDCTSSDSVDWSVIVGNKTLEDGGHFGDLMKLGRLHIEDSKYRGELTEQDSGQVYSSLMTTAITQSINFELVRALRDMEVCSLENKTENEKCLAESECALKDAQIIEIGLESGRKDCTTTAQCALTAQQEALALEQTESEDKNNMDDGMIDNQIDEMIAKVDIAKTQVALDQANSIAQIDKVMGYDYTLDGDGNIIVGADAGDGKMDAEVDKINAEKDLIIEQTESEDMQNMDDGVIDNQIYKLQEDVELAKTQVALEQANSIAQIDKVMGYKYYVDGDGNPVVTGDAGDGKLDAEKDLIFEQIEQIKCDCTNNTATTSSNISLNASQENKLACECCNNSKQTESQLLVNDAQIDKMICDCCNDTTSTASKASLDRVQETKIECDCTNETNLADVKVELTEKEIAGIEYSARQKLYDSQLVAWAVVYADMQLPDTPMSVKEDAIDKSYKEIVTFLGTT